jgi:hypothetical protein
MPNTYDAENKPIPAKERVFLKADSGKRIRRQTRNVMPEIKFSHGSTMGANHRPPFINRTGRAKMNKMKQMPSSTLPMFLRVSFMVVMLVDESLLLRKR